MNKNLELYPTLDNSNHSSSENSAIFSESSKLLTPFNEYVSDLVNQVSLHNIKNIIKHLSSYSTRFTYSSNIILARKWIYKQFVTMGYSNVMYQDFILCDSLQKNIICSKAGSGELNKILILCAHYDSTGRSTSKWNWEKSPAPGANDNASGIASMLEIARILKNVGMNYTVRFIAFTGEEQNLWGSRAYAKYAKSNKMNIILVINLDEIGYPEVKPAWKINIGKDQDNHTSPKNANSYNFSQVMAQAAATYTSLDVRYVDVWASDHKPFHSAGYSVVGVCQDGKYPHSHKVTDTYAHIDMDYIVEVTKMTLATIMYVAGMQQD